MILKIVLFYCPLDDRLVPSAQRNHRFVVLQESDLGDVCTVASETAPLSLKQGERVRQGMSCKWQLVTLVSVCNRRDKRYDSNRVSTHVRIAAGESEEDYQPKVVSCNQQLAIFRATQTVDVSPIITNGPDTWVGGMLVHNIMQELGILIWIREDVFLSVYSVHVSSKLELASLP